MAIYSLSVSNVSRGAGSSTLATLSYITAEKVRDERLGVTFYGFGRRERVVATGTLLPEGARAEWRDAKALFNALELHEKAANARCGKKIIIALPREWEPGLAERVVREWISEQLCDRGYGAAYAIHTDDEGRNPHVHVLVANRTITKDGQWGVKQKKEYTLDAAGARIPMIDKRTGEQKVDSRGRKQWKRHTVECHPLDEKKTLEALRASWAQTANAYLAADSQIDHRSLEAQGIDRVPTIHEGYAARGLYARWENSDRMNLADEIRQANSRISDVQSELARVEAAIQAVKQAAINGVERLRSLVESVRSSEFVFRVSDYIERLKDKGVSVLERGKDFLYSTSDASATGTQLGPQYTRSAVEDALLERAKDLGRRYNRLEADRSQRLVDDIEAGGLGSHREWARDLTMRAGDVIRPVEYLWRSAEDANMFKRPGLRQQAQDAAQTATTQLKELMPWWEGEVQPDRTGPCLTEIKTQVHDQARARALEELPGLKQTVAQQNLFEDAQEWASSVRAAKAAELAMPVGTSATEYWPIEPLPRPPSLVHESRRGMTL